MNGEDRWQAPDRAEIASVGSSVEDDVKPTRKPSIKIPFKIAQDDVEPLGSKADMDRAKECLGPFAGGKVGPSPAEDEAYAA
jgi:hypothetical protein